MIVLDTNVVSEPLRSRPHSAAVDWLDRQVIETLYLTTITLAELRFGVAALPAGRRRDRLGARIEDEVIGAFAGRATRTIVLPRPGRCATTIVAARRPTGGPVRGWQIQ